VSADGPLWQFGDPWRDFGAEMQAAGTVIAVTENGTSHLVDAADFWWTRLPAGQAEPDQGAKRSLRMVGRRSSPCGLTLYVTMSQWWWTTRVVALLPGTAPFTGATAAVWADRAAAMRADGIEADLSAHPDEWCHQPGCPVNRPAR
jgi:hypothetical protein